jgi:hypothetical protein
VNRVLDVGGAFGKSTFSSPSGVFEDLPKWAFTPIRVTLRPFSVVAQKNRLSEILAVRVEATRFNGGFRDEEFNAVAGTFNEPGELTWGWYGLVDLGVLFWLKD